MATLIDARIADDRLVLVGPRGSGTPVEIQLLRLELASEDGEIDWCRLQARTTAPDWPALPDGRPAATGTVAEFEILLGLAADCLAPLDGRDAADVTTELLAGELPELSQASNWYLLVTTPADGEPDATAWAARPLVGTPPPPAPVSPLVARVLAVLFQEGWEPRRSDAEPGVIVASVEPEDGWTLMVVVDDDTGEVSVELVLPEAPELPSGITGPGGSGLATLEVDADGARAYARVHTVDAALPASTVAGMIDAVLDAGREWMDLDEP